MKRTGNLIPDIADMNNLYFAFHKASKAKRGKSEVLLYEKNLDRNLKKLRCQILKAEVSVGNYHYFKIFDPKERVICAASFPERVLHHALMNICHPVFEKQFIYHTYATRPGKGTYAALDKSKEYVKKYRWYAKLDVRKYFDSISHAKLYDLLRRKIKDYSLLKIFSDIISSYSVTEGKGIPIGNLTSQYFANYFLSPADHFAKEKLRIPGYIRYMDDILIFEKGQESLKNKMKLFRDFVEDNFCLRYKPAIINKTEIGVSFLGYRIFPGFVKLNKVSKRRFIRKMSNYKYLLKTGEWCQEEFSRHVLPLIAFTDYANTKTMRYNLLYNENA